MNRNKRTQKPKKVRSIRYAVGIFAGLALFFFLIGYVYLIKAYTGKGSSPALAYIFMLINILELTIFPIMTVKGLKDTKPGYYMKYSIIWGVILLLQIVCIILQTNISAPVFLGVPSAMIVRNCQDWWKNAGDLDTIVHDYGTYNMLFLLGDILAILMSASGILAPILQKCWNEPKSEAKQ